MPEQIQLIDIAPEACVDLKIETPATTIYLVAAFCRQSSGGYWKIHRETGLDEHAYYSKAEIHAQGLAPQWTHRKIIRVDLSS